MASQKPIFLTTHPRSCSTAFERVFMTRRDLTCVHEPFGDAFYFGPERLSERYEGDEKARVDIGFSESTYKTIMDRFDREAQEGKRLFIKDITHYIVPPYEKPATIAPSLARIKRGVGTDNSGPKATTSSVVSNGDVITTTNGANSLVESKNPTVIPEEMFGKFHFTFLIRHPRSSIPSYFRCTVPPLDSVTRFYNYMPSEAGYSELRRFFDFLRAVGQIGPGVAGRSDHGAESNGATNGSSDGRGRDGKVDICVVDADDLLDNPAGIVAAYCRSVGLEYDPAMLSWDSEEHQKRAHEAFAKWKGFHDDALQSSALNQRTHKARTVKSSAEQDQEWVEKFGEDGAKVIRETVDSCVEDYEYLKQFALKA